MTEMLIARSQAAFTHYDQEAASASFEATEVDEGATPRRLNSADLPAVERHLLRLSPRDRSARFMGGCGDDCIRAHARGLDASRSILVGAFDSSERLVGYAQAHPVEQQDMVEVAVSIDQVCRRQGIGRRLVTRILALAFADGARLAEFNFDQSNRALIALVRALLARFGEVLAAPGSVTPRTSRPALRPNAERPLAVAAQLCCALAQRRPQ